MSSPNDLAVAGQAFLIAALAILRELRVVPPPVDHPYIEVGRDYAGPDLMGLPEFTRFEESIASSYPRFDTRRPLGEYEFAANYIFGFLETAVERGCLPDGRFEVEGLPTTTSLSDLDDALRASTSEVVCCRVVSHLTTIDRKALDIADVTIIPAVDGRFPALEVIDSVIPGSQTAYNRRRPLVSARPEAVIVARFREELPIREYPYHVSARIERLLLLLRLLYASTSESIIEVQGEVRPIRTLKPSVVSFQGRGGSVMSMHTVRRTVRLRLEDKQPIESLLRLMADVDLERPGFAQTSFAMAVDQFTASYHAHSWREQVLVLTTALEAAMSGVGRTDILLRLKSRCAALLATEDDPAGVIFRDIHGLYDLRSTLIHGGELKQARLEKRLKEISTVPNDTAFLDSAIRAIDRLRDLARRGLLARVGLASGDPRLWALGHDEGVDEALADDKTKRIWRETWMNKFADMGALDAVGPSRTAAGLLSQDDR